MSRQLKEIMSARLLQESQVESVAAVQGSKQETQEQEQVEESKNAEVT